MKKVLLSLITLCSMGGSLAQTHRVSTEPTQKNALLEVFTGIHCAWCSQGDLVSQHLLSGMPGRAFVIDIHAGSYANPSTGDPDYRTDEGAEILNQYEVNSFPSGMVNRRSWEGDVLLGRSLWIPAALIITEETAPVNLYLSSSYDGSNRTLTVHVEGYFTAEQQASDQRLCVVLTQNGIVGPQNGAATENYEHNHMLRAFLTPVWGEDLGTAIRGQYFTKDYTYSVPEAYKEVDVKPEDLNVIAFVVSGKDEVQNVAGVKPSYINYGLALAGTLSNPNLSIGTRYGYNFFDVRLKNLSAHQLTSATFDVTVNGETTTQTVDVDINQFGWQEIRIPAVYTYADKGKTKFELKLTQLNGEEVDAAMLNGSFQKPRNSNQTVYVQMMTDVCADQNHFYLKDADGNILKEFGPFPNGVAGIYYDTLTVETGKVYCIEVTDDYGDGLNEGQRGGLIVHSGTGALIDQFYQINGYGTRSFFFVDGTDDITGIVNREEAGDEKYFTVDGRRAENLDKGIYVVRKGKMARKIIIQ